MCLENKKFVVKFGKPGRPAREDQALRNQLQREVDRISSSAFARLEEQSVCSLVVRPLDQAVIVALRKEHRPCCGFKSSEVLFFFYHNVPRQVI